MNNFYKMEEIRATLVPEAEGRIEVTRLSVRYNNIKTREAART